MTAPATPSAVSPFTFARLPDDRVVIALAAHLDLQTRDTLKRMVVDAITDGARTVIVELGACGYIDSSGLGVLVSISKKARDAGGDVVISGANDDLRTLFELTKLDEILTLDPPLNSTNPTT